MIENLVVFGCGWTQGVELEDPKSSYPALVATHYNLYIEDQTVQNTSLKDMVIQCSSWLATHTEEDIAKTLILIGLTNEDRPNVSDGEKNYMVAVSAFDALAKHYNVEMVQFDVLTRYHKIKLPTLIESSSALEMLVIRNKPRKNPLFTEHKFPNEKGHKILSDFLIGKIESVIIHE